MDLIGIPGVVVISYMITEIFKVFINKKYLPIVAGISGGVLGVLSFVLQIDIMPATDIISALAIGIISGLAATGSNQIIKQIKVEEKKNDRNKNRRNNK
jgi:ABC-type uncharacterized transport system permease subunit